MAGSWIKVDTTLTTRPQVVRIASALKRTISDTIGACVVFWCAATEQGIDGNLPEWDNSVVDALVGIEGFAKALRSVGWLLDLPGDRSGLQVPKWEEHNAASAKRLALDRERKRKVRLSSAKRPHPVRKQSASCPQVDGQHSPSPSVSDSSVLSEGGVGGDDPWGKPKRVYTDPPKASVTDPSGVGEVRDMLVGFGFNPSNAYNLAKKPTATKVRVSWLVAEAKRRLEARSIDKDKAMGFVFAGIRDGLDPDPGPVVEEYGAKIMRMIQEEKDYIARSKRGET